jgi:3-oxoacyl-[acyl-carrier protein] reductase
MEKDRAILLKISYQVGRTVHQFMKGKVVLVVGRAGSIGAVSARPFAEQGTSAAIRHPDAPEEATAVVKEVPWLLREGHAALVADLTQTDTLRFLRNEIERRFGRLDVLVNRLVALTIPMRLR